MLDEHMGPIKKYSILTVGAVVLALANYVFKFPKLSYKDRCQVCLYRRL